MGFISRKLLPACGNMCVCCPALRPSSQHPVKRYRKLLSQIFPKNFDGPPNDRKILKLCEYAARNPLRLPKITKFLEQRSYKELRSDHANYIKIIAETYCKLLLTCKEQIAYFAASLLNVILELLDDKRAETVHVVGLQTLTQFIYSQGDATYAHSIENLAHRVCEISRKEGSSRLLKAASLESLSATAWFMREFSHLFAGLDEIIIVALENYDSERHVSRPNWVNEVTGLDIPRITDASLLTREESEQPGVWAKICIQRIIEYAKENSTMRRILEPVFIFIDSRKLWIPDNDLSMTIFSDISNLVNGSGKEQTLVSAIIRHLDHKNITQEPKLKSNILQIAAGLIKELRSKKSVPEVGVVSDLCRHLRKSLQTTVEVAAVEESGSSLQTSIHSCLLEIAKGIEDARPLFDMMAITLEDLPQIAVHSKAMIGSLLILAHIISVTVRSRSETVFPEALLLQLLKVMMHPDPETRVGAHQIFSILLVRNPTRVAPDGIFEARKFQTKTTSAFTSASALLEKLRREKEFLVSEENEIIGEHSKLSGPVLEERAQEVSIAVLSEDQISQLLSAFWIQANQEDNFPFNFEAIAHSFSLTLLSSRLKSVNQNILASFFQLPLSLRKISLDSKGYLPVHQRSVFSISTAMLGFAGKIYRVPELTEFLKSSKFAYDDPFLNISDEFQINVKSNSDLRDYNSEADQRAAAASLSILKKSTDECDGSLPLILLRALSRLTDLGVDSLNKLMSECFTPDDGLLFGPKFAFNWARTPELAHSEESLSLDEDCGRASCVSGDVTSASPALHHHRFISKKNNLPSLPQVISVGQLLESALQVAGQVAGTCISTSPLPYGTMASQCEALGEGTRKKFSHWLGSSDSLEQDQPRSALHALSHLSLGKETSNLGLDMNDEGFPRAETCTTLRLPPASPFDNFWKAARY